MKQWQYKPTLVNGQPVEVNTQVTINFALAGRIRRGARAPLSGTLEPEALMYCPECRTEYREGFTECADCRVPLVAGTPPPDAADPFDPSLELVVVLESNNPVQLAMATGLLEEAGNSLLRPGANYEARQRSQSFPE